MLTCAEEARGGETSHVTLLASLLFLLLAKKSSAVHMNSTKRNERRQLHKGMGPARALPRMMR